VRLDPDPHGPSTPDQQPGHDHGEEFAFGRDLVLDSPERAPHDLTWAPTTATAPEVMTMQAIVQDKYGAAEDVLRLEETATATTSAAMPPTRSPRRWPTTTPEPTTDRNGPTQQHHCFR
jgi:hypothetical protein